MSALTTRTRPARWRDALTNARREAIWDALGRALPWVARAVRLHPDWNAERLGIEVLHDVPYLGTGHPKHRLDVYRPKRRDGRPPAVLYAHGGGFRLMSKETHRLLALWFARRGHVVFNAGYRLAPEHRYPAPVEDLASAYAWVVEHAEEWGADPTRLVLAGDSAGANLVTAVAIACSYRRAEPFARRLFELGVVASAVLPASGIYQLSDARRLVPSGMGPLSTAIGDVVEHMERFYLGDERRRASNLDLADPVCFLERGERPDRPLPPFFISAAEVDIVRSDAERLDRALRSLGATAESRVYPGIHDFHVLPSFESSRACWRDTFAFLDQHCPVGGADDALVTAGLRVTCGEGEQTATRRVATRRT